MNIADLTPIQLILVIIGSWFWVYVAGRLASAGILKSWWDFISQKRKPPKGTKEEET